MSISKILMGIVFSLLLTLPIFSQNEFYKQRSASIDDRVKDLLSRMTLEEKIDLLSGTGFATKPNSRLGIPELRMTDGPLGVRWGNSTAFPAGICLAASWNPVLAEKVGAAIGREVKGHDRHVILGLCVNIARIPQGGRSFESYEEDSRRRGSCFWKADDNKLYTCDCNAFAVAWLPGTEGEGVADVIFGDYKPTGKLCHTWPSGMSSVPVNYGDANYDPLFPYGFGLTY